jgi:hypothetical protein
MKKVFISLLIVAAFAFTACNGGWTSAEKDNFMNSCTGGLKGVIEDDIAKKYCECSLEKLEKKYPTAKEADADSDNIKDVISECTDLLK